MSKGTVNTIILVGNVGQEPVQRPAKNDIVLNFSMATTETYNGQDHTQWHRITAFGKMAENLSPYIKKGSKLFVSGRLQTSTYKDKNGVEKLSVDVIANQIQLLNRVEGEAGSAPARSPKAAPAEQIPADYDDDIPF